MLKLGIINPLPKKLIEEFAKEVEELYVIEELEPVIEEQVRSWGIKVKGKELFTKQGEYSVNLIKQVILNENDSVFSKEIVPNRPPIMCPGCPHRSVFSILKKLKIHASGYRMLHARRSCSFIGYRYYRMYGRKYFYATRHGKG